MIEDMMNDALPTGQAFLLKWLGMAETSAYGECRGADLDALVSRGFAEIGPLPAGRSDENYRPVSLTEAGIGALPA